MAVLLGALRAGAVEILGYISSGGFVMWPLLLAAFLLWYGIGHRAFSVRRGSRLEVRELIDYYRANPHGGTQGFVDGAVQAGLAVRRSQERDIRRHLDDELFPLEEGVARYRVLVKTIVVIAPLLGLLGTVNGMIEMFESLGNQTFFSQSGGVANGISRALFTTQFGLVVAIPGMIVGGLIDRKERRIRDDIEQVKDLLVAGHFESNLERSA
ncbi:MAG: MotA/TolQ/ExbB proton channel family protein [Spirochaetota bacterium]